MEDQFCSLILENKYHLLKFWNKMESEKRKVIIDESRKDFNEQFNSNRNKKKNKLPVIYQKFKDKYIETDVEEEVVVEYFGQFLQKNKDKDSWFVDHLFFAQIYQTTSIYPFIFRIILKKLQYQFTSQLTDNLINDEKEKQMYKSKKKQKKNKKQRMENSYLEFSQTSSTTDDVEVKECNQKQQKTIESNKCGFGYNNDDKSDYEETKNGDQVEKQKNNKNQDQILDIQSLNVWQ